MKKFKLYKLKPTIFFAGLLCVIITLLIFTYPKEALSGGFNGLIICAEIIIPSLFPFMVVTLFISKSGIAYYIGKIIRPVTSLLFNISGESGSVLFLSYLAGYPVGARLTRELYENNKIGINEARRLLYYTVNAGPAFILAAVGTGILHSTHAGIILLISHISASIIIALVIGIFSRIQKDENKTTITRHEHKPVTVAFVEATADAASSVINICAWVILFSTFIYVINKTALPNNTVILISSISEVTTGISLIANKFNIPLIAAFLGWAGLSVQCQVLSSAGNIRPNVWKFIITRVVHGGLSAVISFIILKIFPIAVSTIGNGEEVKPRGSSVSLPASLALIFMSIILLGFLSERGNSDNNIM